MNDASTHKEEVLFTIPEFAFLVSRNEAYIEQALRDGKIKGIQRKKGATWRIPESELVRYWGNLYKGATRNGEGGD